MKTTALCIMACLALPATSASAFDFSGLLRSQTNESIVHQIGSDNFAASIQTSGDNFSFIFQGGENHRRLHIQDGHSVDVSVQVNAPRNRVETRTIVGRSKTYSAHIEFSRP